MGEKEQEVIAVLKAFYYDLLWSDGVNTWESIRGIDSFINYRGDEFSLDFNV